MLANPIATRSTFAWRADRIASGRLIASPASNAAAASRTCAASRSGTRANADQNDPITPPPHAHRAPAKAGAQDHAAHRSTLWAPAFAGAQADAHAPRSRPPLPCTPTPPLTPRHRAPRIIHRPALPPHPPPGGLHAHAPTPLHHHHPPP